MKPKTSEMFFYSILCVAELVIFTNAISVLLNHFFIFKSAWDRGVVLVQDHSNQLILVEAIVGLLLTLFYLEIYNRSDALKQHFDKWIKIGYFLKILLLGVLFLAFTKNGQDPHEFDSANYLPPKLDQRSNSIMLLTGMLLSQMIIVVKGMKQYSKIAYRPIFVLFLVCLLTLSSSINADLFHVYYYRGLVRKAALWGNPNIYGMLMGTGIILVCGLLISNKPHNICKLKWRRSSLRVVFLFIALGIMFFGLLQSYSRGAWLAFVCATLLLFIKFIQGGGQEFKYRIATNVIGVTVCFAVFALGCEHWHYMETPLMQRVNSVYNKCDFSWRNRVTAWEGALQIIGEHPWFGTGWNQLEPLYEHFYLPFKLTRSTITAVEMNDYLMLGATLGIFTLFYFGMYIWLSLIHNAKCAVPSFFNEETKKQNPGNESEKRDAAQSDWLKVVCHAGAIVLLIGFWFDGGLFKLPTASTFWILLELGAA